MTERGRWKELDEAELREGIASALTKGVYGRLDQKTVDQRWQSEPKEQSPEAAEGPRCWQGCHNKTDTTLLQTLPLNGVETHLYVSVLIFHPFLPFTQLPYCYPFAPNSFLVAKTSLGLYQTMPNASGLFGFYC